MEKYPIEFKKGEVFAFTLIYVNNNGSLFTEATGTVTCQFTAKERYTDSSPTISLTKGAGIAYNASTGEFTVTIPAATTASITWAKGVYDMWINSATNGKDYVLDGIITVLPNVG